MATPAHQKTDPRLVAIRAIGFIGSSGATAAGETADKPYGNNKMSDTRQSVREYSLEMPDESTLDISLAISISTDNENSLSSIKLDNLPMSLIVDGINKGLLDLIHPAGESEDSEDGDITLESIESIGPDQGEGE